MPTAARMCAMSASTIDRRLGGEHKRLELNGRSGTKPGSLLKSQIPIGHRSRIGVPRSFKTANFAVVVTAACFARWALGQSLVDLGDQARDDLQ
jgi:hypothetical protein